jgi:hypothetical protein
MEVYRPGRELSKAVPASQRRSGVGGAPIGLASHQNSFRLSARAKLPLPDSPKPAGAFAGSSATPLAAGAEVDSRESLNASVRGPL